jgi:hypothetical protein
LNLIKIDSYPELVNLAISQEDAMKRAQQDGKRSSIKLQAVAEARNLNL